MREDKDWLAKAERFTEEQVKEKYGHFKCVVPVSGQKILGFPSLGDEYVEFQRFVGSLTAETFRPITRGRSSTKLHVHDKFGNQYGMFLNDISYFLRCAVRGTVFGIWHFRKQGANYGLYLERGFTEDSDFTNMYNPIPTDLELAGATKCVAKAIDRIILERTLESV